MEVVSRLDSTQLSALEVLEGCVRTRLEDSPAALQLQLLHMSSSRVLTQLAHIVGIPADTRCSLVPSCRKEMPILKLRKDDNNRGSRICKCCAAFTLKCFWGISPEGHDEGIRSEGRETGSYRNLKLDVKVKSEKKIYIFSFGGRIIFPVQ